MSLTRLAVGDLSIRPALLLAPMAGLTHTAFRRLLAGLGGIGLLATEMLSARSLPAEDLQSSPYLIRTPDENPVSHQVLVASPDGVNPAFEVLQRLGAEVIDLNLGCPAPVARQRGAGSWLVKRPAALRAVVAEARRCTRGPLSAKIRLGERLDEGALRESCRILEGEGIDLITVHARLRADPYGRKPRWEWVGKVKSWLSVPVVGNGGIFSVADAKRCLSASGCDGLMLGRGAVVRPWLFAEVARELCGLDIHLPTGSRPEWFRRFATLLVESFPPERRLGRLKQFTHYFSQTYAFGHSLASAVQASQTWDAACTHAEMFFARDERASFAAEKTA